VSVAGFRMALRLRLITAVLASLGMIAVILMVGALFPALGDTIGKVNLPKGVADLLGGANYGTLSGWLKGEIVSIYGPLVVAAVAITSAVGATAGEEEDRILALVLAHPVERSALIVAKAAAVAVSVLVIALATWLGLIAGVAVAGGGIGVGDLGAQSLHMAFFGFAVGSVALALGAATGQKALASGGAAAFAILAFLVNGFAPLVGAIAWLKYLSVFHYYEGHDPLTNGADVGDLVVLGSFALILTATAVLGIRRRDLRG
jgi:beta-exotoxin I transport system permease protein